MDSLSEHVLLREQLLVGVVCHEVDLVDIRDASALSEGQPQATAKNLLGQGLGGQPPQGHDDRDVLHVPALAEHVHAHDGADRRVRLLDLRQRLQGLVGGLRGDLQHLRTVTDHARLGEQLTDLGGVLDGLAHHEQHGLDRRSIRAGLAIDLVGLLLVTEQLAGVLQLRPLVLRAVLAVDDDRDLHVPVSDGLT